VGKYDIKLKLIRGSPVAAPTSMVPTSPSKSFLHALQYISQQLLLSTAPKSSRREISLIIPFPHESRCRSYVFHVFMRKKERGLDGAAKSSISNYEPLWDEKVIPTYIPKLPWPLPFCNPSYVSTYCLCPSSHFICLVWFNFFWHWKKWTL